jgi:hypothetical protein
MPQEQLLSRVNWAVMEQMADLVVVDLEQCLAATEEWEVSAELVELFMVEV